LLISSSDCLVAPTLAHICSSNVNMLWAHSRSGSWSQTSYSDNQNVSESKLSKRRASSIGGVKEASSSSVSILLVICGAWGRTAHELAIQIHIQSQRTACQRLCYCHHLGRLDHHR
jgi:hypothetical protein